MANRYTVFDVMEKRGDFRKNPANIGSQSDDGESLYSGPIQYPKMLFHPQGEEEIIYQGDVINTPYGPQKIMEQRAIIHKIAHNQAEEEALIAEGWHQHPAEAMVAAGKEAPATGADRVIADLQKKIAALEAQRTQLESIHPMSKPSI